MSRQGKRQARKGTRNISPSSPPPAAGLVPLFGAKALCSAKAGCAARRRRRAERAHRYAFALKDVKSRYGSATHFIESFCIEAHGRGTRSRHTQAGRRTGQATRAPASGALRQAVSSSLQGACRGTAVARCRRAAALGRARAHAEWAGEPHRRRNLPLPRLTVKRAILNRFGEVHRADGLGSVEVGNRARDLEDAVEGAGAEA